MPRGSKSINRPPTPEPEDQSRELSLVEDIRLRVRVTLTVSLLFALTALTLNIFCFAAGPKWNRAQVSISTVQSAFLTL